MTFMNKCVKNNLPKLLKFYVNGHFKNVQNRKSKTLSGKKNKKYSHHKF